MDRLLLQGGLIFDGTGKEPRKADLLIAGGRIEGVLSPGADAQAVDAVNITGLAAAPGFIDFHSHADWVVPQAEHGNILMPLTLQGVTTFMGGNCGFSPFPVSPESRELVLENSRFLTNERFGFRWTDMKSYMDCLRRQGVSMNAAVLAGHGTARAFLFGNRPEALNEKEMGLLTAELEKALSDGAFGVSLGLSYVPGIFADEKEVEAVFRVAAQAGTVLTIHGRTYSQISPYYPVTPGGEPHVIRDLRFSIEMAAKTGAKLHISHLLLKGTKTWGLWRDALRLIEEANDAGTDVTFGVIPYHWGNTLILTLFPRWFLDDFAGSIAQPDKVKRLKAELEETEAAIGRGFSELYLLWGIDESLKKFEGKSFSAIAEELGVDDADACLYIAEKSGGGAKVLTAAYSGREDEYSEPLEQFIRHPLSMIEIDTILTSPHGPQNPASFGACPKLLGRYAREKGLMSMAAAVRKITGAPADRFGLQGRGYLKEGFSADVTVFNPETIKDANSIKSPSLPPAGVEHVLVNGRFAVRNGSSCGSTAYGHVMLRDK